jgi:hypothetical protein
VAKISQRVPQTWPCFGGSPNRGIVVNVTRSDGSDRWRRSGRVATEGGALPVSVPLRAASSKGTCRREMHPIPLPVLVSHWDRSKCDRPPSAPQAELTNCSQAFEKYRNRRGSLVSAPRFAFWCDTDWDTRRGHAALDHPSVNTPTTNLGVRSSKTSP